MGARLREDSSARRRTKGSTSDPHIGRYQLLRQLGRGAAGVVFAALDPELDRKVAIKLIPSSRDLDGQSGARLLREAQLLAQLSHPNVVAVHDVARLDDLDDLTGLDAAEGGIYMVMELVEGPDLTAWCDVPCEQAQVLPVLLEAGRGLAAAHGAGLVHRDVKPENINVGEDGRVRVLDFGLAITSLDDARSSLVGTPAYMAPELHAGRPATAKSDQYAFAVTAYEMLLGQKPFVGDLALLPELKQDGPLFPDRPRLPGRIRRALIRALAPEPDQRWPDMDALLKALDPEQARRRQLLAGVGTLAIASAAALWIVPGPSPEVAVPSCESPSSPVAQVWSAERRAAVAEAFERTQIVDAADSWQRAESRIERYLADWTSMRAAACEATHVERSQSEALLDLQEACLDRRLGHLDALLSELEVADAGVVTMAVLAVDNLEPLDPCADLEGLLRGTPPPADADVARAVEELEARLTQARAARFAGRYAEARRRSTAVLEAAETLDHPPLTVSAHLELSRVALQTSDWRVGMAHALAAATGAERIRAEALAADGWIQLVWHAGVEGELQSEAERWYVLADAAVDRLGEDPLRRAELAHSRAGLRYRQGRYAEALVDYQEALALQQAFLDPDHPDVATTLNHIANVNIMAGDFGAAVGFARRSLALRQGVLGPHHPKVAACHNNLAAAWSRAKSPGQALDHTQSALRIVGGTGTVEERIALRIAASSYQQLGLDREANDATASADAIERGE